VKAQQLAEATGQVLVPPYNNGDVMAGQGTIGLELVEQLPQLSLILVPIGGGGLISGIAAAVKAIKPSVRIVGVEPELAADAQESLAAGKAIEWPAAKAGRTIADSLRTQSLGPLSFTHIAALVDEIVTVSDEEILDAAVALLSDRHLVVEPAGAVSVAALRSGKFAAEGTAAVVSGGNASVAMLTEMLRRTDRTQMSALGQGPPENQQEALGDPYAPAEQASSSLEEPWPDRIA
jgi:threonine dehydratase